MPVFEHLNTRTEKMALKIQGFITNMLKVMNHKKQTADSATKRCKHICCESFVDDDNAETKPFIRVNITSISILSLKK
jgi:hypothetical protein